VHTVEATYDPSKKSHDRFVLRRAPRTMEHAVFKAFSLRMVA
jgi:hypothetical protein